MRYEPLNLPFSTADAEQPRISLENGQARVSFQDWRGSRVELLFDGVVAISWDDGDASVPAGQSDDRSYVVHDSPWLARHREAQTIGPADHRKHFLLAFNAIGVLQVLASSVAIVSPTATESPDR